MAGVARAAKQTKFGQAKAGLSLATQARIRLELVDDRDEIVHADDSFKLEASAIVAGPDDIGLDPTDYGHADNDAIAALQLVGIVDHETMRGQIADVQMQIAMHEVLDDRGKIDRMPRCTPQVGYAEISSTRHAMRSFRRLRHRKEMQHKG